MKGSRKIVVDGREWHYKVGKWNVVAIAQDNLEKRLIDFVSLTEMEPQTIEKMNLLVNKHSHIGLLSK